MEVRFRDAATAECGAAIIQDSLQELADSRERRMAPMSRWWPAFNPVAGRKIQEQALKQNITTLHNRINELGVAEPVIQQQGLDRIVVQLPGVQDTAKAKDILGRTATLEVRMVDESTPRPVQPNRHRRCALWVRAFSGAQRPGRDRQKAGHSDR
jgi:preprotein translocase subunit SecD